MIYGLLLMLMVFINIPISLFNWWLVFGIWPKSWTWFVAFAFISWGQSELAKWLTTKMIEDVKGNI